MTRSGAGLLGALCATLGACGGRYHAGVSLEPGQSAQVVVMGSSPYVNIRNAGPGGVLVDVRIPEQDRAEGQRLHAGASLGRGASRGPIEIVVRAEDERVGVRFDAQRATAVARHATPMNDGPTAAGASRGGV